VAWLVEWAPACEVMAGQMPLDFPRGSYALLVFSPEHPFSVQPDRFASAEDSDAERVSPSGWPCDNDCAFGFAPAFCAAQLDSLRSGHAAGNNRMREVCLVRLPERVRHGWPALASQ
jgi:hypothetical protein